MISGSATNFVNELIEQLPDYSPIDDRPRRLLVAQAKGVLLQEIATLSLADSNYKKEIVEDGLVSNTIFTLDDDDNAVCPFLSFDAFSKAVLGHSKVLQTVKGIKKDNLLTIIDFTVPSNQRRLYLIDLDEEKVLNNTWVAHGIGNNYAAGGDGYGSNPQISNTPNSKMSSDGFMLATIASYGNVFGNNVLLKGLDSKNTNVTARQILIHGWSSPMGQYTSGILDEDSDGNEILLNAFRELMKLEMNTSTQREIEGSLDNLSQSLSISKFLAPTEGCPGVPVANLSHLDPKGRGNKNVLEQLREDLPGSVIFTYSGPGMTSKYFAN